MSWKKNAGSPFETYKHDAVATNGMVSTNHPLGSAAGLEMLAMGGNAMDAAVASAFALSVVEPMMIGIFGAGFINFYNASDDEFVNIDNYSVAPHAATPDMYETISGHLARHTWRLRTAPTSWATGRSVCPAR